LPSTSPLHSGQVVAAYGRQYLVELNEGEIITCFTRAKRSLLACGDHVAVMRTAPGQGVVEAIDPRRTLLYRSDAHRQKLIAANIDQVVIVLAPFPSFYQELLDRCLVAAEHERIRPLIVLNKFDLVDQSENPRQTLRLYETLGYKVLTLIAKEDVAPLRPQLQNRLSVLIGQSGMGKSTIINALIPGAHALVGDISIALDSGRHTTTHAKLYRLDARSGLIDSPGMQAFGLHHIPVSKLQFCFPEFRPFLGQCRFADCAHYGEPDCAVRSAAHSGDIDAHRMRTYRRLVEEARRLPRL